MNLDERLLHQVYDRGWKNQPLLALLSTIGLGLLAGLLTILQAGKLSQVIERVFLEGWNLSQAAGLLQILLVLIILRAGLIWAGELAAHSLARQVKGDLRRQLVESLFTDQPGSQFAGEQQLESTGELASVYIEGVETLEAYYSQYLPQLALAALVPLACLLFVFPIDWISGLVLLLTAPLIPLFMILIGGLAQALTRRQWLALSRMNAYFLDVLQGLTTLKIFGRSQAQAALISQVSERYRQTTMGVLRVTFLSALVLEMVATLSTAVVAVEVGLRLLYGQMVFEQAFFVLLLAPEFYLPLRQLGARFHAGMAGVAASRRIFEVLDQRQPVIAGAETKIKITDQAIHSDFHLETIRFSQVSCQYPGEHHALQNISFEIKAGQKIALVGPSGAGKSTVANLLLGFIQPNEGELLVNKNPLSTLNMTDWRRQIAWVPQSPHLFYASVADNIHLAKPGASLPEIIQAARLAQAHEFIIGLPEGYNTLLGERGANLSAGQAQRIALARAFLKDAPLVILDEPTTSLDPQTEASLQHAMATLLSGRTALIIAHRLYTISDADHILVLDQGRLVQSGSQAELTVSGGLYQRMTSAMGISLPAVSQSPPMAQPSVAAEANDTAAIVQEQNWIANLSSAPERASTLRRLVRLVRPFSGQVALSVLAGFGTIASSIGLLATSAFLISAAALQPSIALLQVPIVGVRFFGISRGVFRYLERLLTHQVTLRVIGRLRVTFYQALEPLAPARLLRYRSGDLLARLSGDIESLENFYVRTIAPPLVASLVALLVVSLLGWWAGPVQALAYLCFLLAAGLGTPLLVRVLSRKAGQALVNQHAALSATFVDSLQGKRDLLVYDHERQQAGRLQAASHTLAATQSRLAWVNGLQNALVSLFSQSGMWAVLALSIPLVTAGQLPGVYLAVLALTVLASFEAAQPLPLAAQVLESNRQAAYRLFEIVDALPEVTDPPDALPMPVEDTLEVTKVSFRYPTTFKTVEEALPAQSVGQPLPLPVLDSPVSPAEFLNGTELAFSLQALEEVTFKLAPGKKLAIVGPSGAGKSTLLGLLLRLWEIQQGQITLGGCDLRRLPQAELRQRMAVVGQNSYLFHATLRDNLRLARPQASTDDLERVLALAQLDTWVRSLPQGLDTWVGEQGQRLSAGQRQRLAIARAILKDAPILLLDEPTANLDVLTEQVILQDLFTLMQNRSVLYITHRLVGMEWMDEILVLNNGRVLERGQHTALLELQGYYWSMFTLQQA